MFYQATSRGIRARNQAMIRIGGEQGRAAVLDCLLAGITARGLFLGAYPMTDEIHVTVFATPIGRTSYWRTPTRYRARGKRSPPARPTRRTHGRRPQRGKRNCGPVLTARRRRSPGQTFRERYEEEHLASLTKDAGNARSTLNQLEKHLDPDRLCKINASALSTFQTKLRATGIKETTIASSLRHVKAALSWGVSVGMLAVDAQDQHAQGGQGPEDEGRCPGGRTIRPDACGRPQGPAQGFRRVGPIPDRLVVVRAPAGRNR